MKQWISLVLCVGMLAAFTACSDKNQDPTDTPSSVSSAVSVAPSSEGTLGKYDVSILGARISSEAEGKYNFFITVKVVNNGTEPITFQDTFNTMGYQDGSLLSAMETTKDTTFDPALLTQEIAAGSELQVEVPFEMINQTSNVKFEISLLTSPENGKLVKEFALKSGTEKN